MIRGGEAIILSVEEASKILEALDLHITRERVKELADLGVWDAVDGLRSAVRSIQDEE